MVLTYIIMANNNNNEPVAELHEIETELHSNAGANECN